MRGDIGCDSPIETLRLGGLSVAASDAVFDLDLRAGRAGGCGSGYLKAFLVTAKHLSFSKAAEEMRVAQSAVSRQVKLLEESLSSPPGTIS